MILAAHILIALSSVVYTSYVFLSPSKAKVRGSYAFIAATLATGTLLIVQHPGSLLQSCISGLAYTLVMTAAIYAVQRKLAHQEN